MIRLCRIDRFGERALRSTRVRYIRSGYKRVRVINGVVYEMTGPTDYGTTNDNVLLIGTLFSQVVRPSEKS